MKIRTYNSKLRYALIPCINFFLFDKKHFTIEIGWINFWININK